MSNKPIIQRQVSASDMSLVIATHADKKFNPGRRAELRYRDLEVTRASGGDMRAEVLELLPGNKSRPNGWHYHTADMQFLYCLRGWLKLEFEATGVVVVQPGDACFIPGGTIHQELEHSEDLEMLEVSVPAKIQTVQVEAPSWAKERSEDYGELSLPQNVGHAAM